MVSGSSGSAAAGVGTGTGRGSIGSERNAVSEPESDRIIITARGGMLPSTAPKPPPAERTIACPCGKMFVSYGSRLDHRNAKALVSRPCPDLPPKQRAVAAVAAVAATATAAATATTAATAADDAPRKPKSKKKKEHERYVRQLIQPDSKMVALVGMSDTTPSPEPVTWRSEGHLVCTYNWANSSNATILVPGGAPVWKSPTPEQLPTNIPASTSLQFKDQNLARLPMHQWLPLFRAMSAMRKHHPASPLLSHPLPGHIPSITSDASSTPTGKPLEPLENFHPVELIINRGSLQNLFNICLNSVQPPFAFRVHLAGQKTLLVERCERKSWTRPFGLDGYGPNFESHFAQWPQGLENSSSHHRVVRYRLGPLDCMVRCEVDVACQEEGTEVDVRNAMDDLQTDANEASSDEEDYEDEGGAEIGAALDTDLDAEIDTGEPVVEDKQPAPADLSKKNHATKPVNLMPRKSSLGIKLAGDASAVPLVPAELKSTVSDNYISNARHHIHQLWFGRTPTIVMGHHDGSGNYSSVAIRNMASALDKWEKMEQNQLALRRLVGLIRKIRGMVRSNARNQPCILLWNGRPKGWIRGTHDVELELWPCRRMHDDKLRHALPFDVNQTWFPRQERPERGRGRPERPPFSGQGRPERPPYSGGGRPERPSHSGQGRPERPSHSGQGRPERPSYFGQGRPERTPSSGGERPGRTVGSTPFSTGQQSTTPASNTQPAPFGRGGNQSR